MIEVDPDSCLRGYCMNLTSLVFLQVGSGEGGVGKEESLPAVVVHIQSSSIAAVCGLHHAVLRRVQVNTRRHTSLAF